MSDLGNYSPLCDIWSLGVILYQLFVFFFCSCLRRLSLSGTLPFKAQSDAMLLALITSVCKESLLCSIDRHRRRSPFQQSSGRMWTRVRLFVHLSLYLCHRIGAGEAHACRGPQPPTDCQRGGPGCMDPRQRTRLGFCFVLEALFDSRRPALCLT
jgi:hypothetical protein